MTIRQFVDLTMPILYGKLMRFRIKYLFLAFVAVAFLTACKKYPENTLWFKNPKNLIADTWYLESYLVDGVDSTSYDDVKMFREKGLTFNQAETYNPINCFEIYHGSWELISKKKHINIRFYREWPASASSNFYSPQKNIFVNENKNDWRIDKLCKNQFWITYTNNNTKYEIRFRN